MKRTLMVGMLTLSLFWLGGCMIISCEEDMCPNQPDVICAPTHDSVQDTHVVSF